MLFNSFVFWVFFAIVISLYYVLDFKSQNRMLLVASYIFYGWWDYRFLALLFLSTTIDYLVGRGLEIVKSEQRRKALLAVSVCVNLGLLGFFKYFGFFSRELASLLQFVGIRASLPSLNIILPVGISFYTFQAMSYTIDLYRRKATVARSFLDFALYVSFFPQLVAGPIERYTHLMSQVESPRSHRPGDFAEGLYHVLLGLLKKVVLADNMAPIANAMFLTPSAELSGFDVLVGVYAFAFQIYGDFSGYSSIAQGLAKWMGFDLMYNFRMPYFAVSPSDFWSRWHISLSSWLRDYLYIPLGGNRSGVRRTYRNLMLTMLLGGLWHGAAWTFVAWGALHGALLCLYRFAENRITSDAVRGWKRFGKTILMFHLVCLSWLFFRATSMAQIGSMIVKVLTDWRVTHFGIYGLSLVILFAGPVMLFEYWLERSRDPVVILRLHWLPRAVVYAAAALALVVFQPRDNYEFIYFQF